MENRIDMKTLDKSKKLEHIGYDIRGPVTDEADRMLAEGIKILKLNTGNPGAFGFNAPDDIIEKLIRDVREAQPYCDSKGILEAREAIAKYSASKGIEGVTVNDVYTGNGVSELISMATQALLDSGDEVLVPSPDYPLWTGAVTLAGGTPVHYICDERSDWNPDIRDMRSKITSRTKAVVIINPNNPTGALYPREVLEEIVQMARENGILIFSDEIYDRMVMDDLEHISTGSLAGDVTTITLNGLSKSHLVAGFRCGWMTISGATERASGYIEGINMLASMRLCSNVLSQTVIKTALERPYSAAGMLEPGGRIYEQREYIHRAINSIPGVSAVKPKAAFYLFPKLDVKKFNIVSDEQFVLDFLHEQHILCTHGGGFHWEKPDHFRLVFLPEMSELEMLAERLARFLETYNQGKRFF